MMTRKAIPMQATTGKRRHHPFIWPGLLIALIASVVVLDVTMIIVSTSSPTVQRGRRVVDVHGQAATIKVVQQDVKRDVDDTP